MAPIGMFIVFPGNKKFLIIGYTDYKIFYLDAKQHEHCATALWEHYGEQYSIFE